MANTVSSRPSGEWFFAGLASSFPNITASTSREPYFKLAWPQPCKAGDPSQAQAPGCKVFHPKPSQTHPSSSVPPPPPASPPPLSPMAVEEVDIDAAPGEDAWRMREQVVVFQYEGTFHAVDHACPHRAYSLSSGQPFDIEDAGRVVGQAIRCKGHSFAFELSTGIGDRGEYRLGVWDVALRHCRENSEAKADARSVELVDDRGETSRAGQVEVGRGTGEREVWVRRRNRGAHGPGQPK